MNKAIRNFLRGMGSVLAIAPTETISRFEPKFYRPAPTVNDALRSDWAKIGEDMRAVLDREYNDKIEKQASQKGRGNA